MPYNNSASTTVGNLVSFDAWLAALDKTRTTGWRWRKTGKVETVNVFGKLYITRDEIFRFEQKALAGDFHEEAHVPSKNRTELAR